MREVFEGFREFCHETFGREDGDIVCRFYNSFFDYTKFKREGVEKKITKQDKIANISKLVEKVGKDRLVECVKYFKEDWEKGLVKTHSLKYFNAVVENLKQIKRPGLSSDTKEIKLITPTKYKKVREGMGTEYLNWDYTCSCSNIIDAWTMECSKCGSLIDWKDISKKL